MVGIQFKESPRGMLATGFCILVLLPGSSWADNRLYFSETGWPEDSSYGQTPDFPQSAFDGQFGSFFLWADVTDTLAGISLDVLRTDESTRFIGSEVFNPPSVEGDRWHILTQGVVTDEAVTSLEGGAFIGLTSSGIGPGTTDFDPGYDPAAGFLFARIDYELLGPAESPQLELRIGRNVVGFQTHSTSNGQILFGDDPNPVADVAGAMSPSGYEALGIDPPAVSIPVDTVPAEVPPLDGPWAHVPSPDGPGSPDDPMEFDPPISLPDELGPDEPSAPEHGPRSIMSLIDGPPTHGEPTVGPFLLDPLVWTYEYEGSDQLVVAPTGTELVYALDNVIDGVLVSRDELQPAVWHSNGSIEGSIEDTDLSLTSFSSTAHSVALTAASDASSMGGPATPEPSSLVLVLLAVSPMWMMRRARCKA